VTLSRAGPVGPGNFRRAGPGRVALRRVALRRVALRRVALRWVALRWVAPRYSRSTT
jgi:hypothetical protein